MAIKLQLPDDIERRLDNLVYQTGKSKLFHIFTAISGYLEDQEDIHNPEQVIRRIKNGTEKIYTAEEVRKILNGEICQKA